MGRLNIVTIWFGGVLMLFASVSCTSTTDPSRASTGDILFDARRFKEENGRKREALEYLQREHGAVMQDDLQLQQTLDERHAELNLVRGELKSIHREIRWLEGEIDRVGDQNIKDQGDPAELVRNETSLNEYRVRQQSLEEEIQEIEGAIDALERMIAKRKDMLGSSSE